MPNEWTEFRNNYYSSIQIHKSKIAIIILGSYYPIEEKDFLIRLKNILIRDGYFNTFLVEDRQNVDDDPLEISQMSMSFSDICILVFTRSGKKYGLIDELNFLTTDMGMQKKMYYSILFDQHDGIRSSIPDLSSSRVRNANLRRRTFNNYIDLENMISREVFWILREYVKREK